MRTAAAERDQLQVSLEAARSDLDTKLQEVAVASKEGLRLQVASLTCTIRCQLEHSS